MKRIAYFEGICEVKAPKLKDLKKFMDTMTRAYTVIENTELLDRFFEMSIESQSVIKFNKGTNMDDAESMISLFNGRK